MDGALFTLLFFFFAQIAAGVAPMLWPQCRWLAGLIFWLSTGGATVSLAWYLYSNSEWWLDSIMGMASGKTIVGASLVVLAVAIGVGGLSLIGGPPPKRNSKLPGPPADVGKLVPEIVLSTQTKQASRIIEIGDSTSMLVFTGPAGEPLFKFAEGYHLKIEEVGGEIKVSTQLRNRKGKLVAELIRNEWKVAPRPRTWDRNYNKHALEVKDEDGNIVLQVRLLPDRVQLQGEWWIDEIKGFRLVKDPQSRAGAMEIMGPAHGPAQVIPIQPIFAYPSELHFGELVQ